MRSLGSIPLNADLDALYAAFNHTHAGGGAPDAHAASHQSGGADEISVAGLSGVLADPQTPAAHNHDAAYEAKNANIQAHIAAAHAPANAQANADITKAEIEAKLTGVVASHSHAGGPDPFSTFVGVLANDVTTGANVTPVNVTGLVFTFLANSVYVIELFGAVSAAAATTGSGIQFDTSTAVPQIAFQFYHQLANAGTLTGGNSIADNASAGVSSGIPAGGGVYPIYGSGIIRSGANGGTAQLQLRSETTAATTLKAGTVMRVHKAA